MTGSSLSDENAIRQLADRYSFYLDTGRKSNWIELWSESGVFDASAMGMGVITGRPALAAFFDGPPSMMKQQCHFGGLHLIEITHRNQATGIKYLTFEFVTPDDQYTRGTLYYEDRYEQVAGHWLIASRKVVMLISPGVAK